MAAVAGLLLIALLVSTNFSTRADARGKMPVPATVPTIQAPQKSPSLLLTKHEWLEPRLESSLPPGTDFNEVTEGFADVRELLVALHVSRNLGIRFEHLKTAMMLPKRQPLAKAIADINPYVKPALEVKRAEQQARKDLEGYGALLDGRSRNLRAGKHRTAENQSG